MEHRRFTDRNNAFICDNCGHSVAPSERSCRNHCPRCLYSLHVDIRPGDRAATCKGLMKPVRVEYNSKKGYQIVHRCLKCHEERRNILALEDAYESDDFDLILQLMKQG